MGIGVGAISAVAAGLLLVTPMAAQANAPADAAVPAAAAPAPAAPTLATLAAERAIAIARRDKAHADDLAALQAHYAASSDRPLWVEGGALSPRARAAMAEIARADDWGLAASSFTLPALQGAADAGALAEAEAQLTLAVLRYARHARGGRIDPTRLTDAIDRTANLLPPSQVLAGIAAASAPDAFLRGLHPQHSQFERLRQLYLALKAGRIEPPLAAEPVAEVPQETTRKGRKRKTKAVAGKPAAPPPLTADRVLFNMEQWRWMPDDLGALHIAVNVPEFQFRVMKAGKSIHTERVVVGTAETQTPIFSKDIQTVVFQPGWGVPPSIKVKQLLPGLLAGRDPVSARGYRMSYRGRVVSAGAIDWRSVDIRKVSIVQPPGPGNALGQVKFLFPNKHDVYMHDTPAKALFNASVRAYSNGCVRVRDPMRLAEIIFAETAGWAPTRVASLARGRPENEVRVAGQIPVHMTYFTVTVDDDGKVHTFRDLYSHEPRVKGGLEGRLDQVARKSQDLGAVRSALVNRAGARRVASNRDADYRSGRGPRARGGPAPRQSGGGFFWFGN